MPRDLRPEGAPAPTPAPGPRMQPQDSPLSTHTTPHDTPQLTLPIRGWLTLTQGSGVPETGRRTVLYRFVANRRGSSRHLAREQREKPPGLGSAPQAQPSARPSPTAGCGPAPTAGGRAARQRPLPSRRPHSCPLRSRFASTLAGDLDNPFSHCAQGLLNRGGHFSG